MSTVALIGRLLLALAAVLCLMWFIARRMKGSGRMAGAGLVDVLGRRQLSRTSSVAVVRVHDQALILGVTDTQVTLIATTDLAAAEAAAAPTIRALPARTSSAPTSSARTSPAPTSPAPTQARRSPRVTTLQGSALSPDTWRRTLDSLRDLTARKR